MLRSRFALAAAAIALPVLAAAPATPAAAAQTCRSADLRYPFQEGGANDFGVFRLRADGASCRTAHRVAKKWMTRFEAAITDGRVALPKRVEGFRFKTLAPHAAQTYTLRGRKGAATIRFDYMVPNG
jgi:hypothetical protein